MNPLERHFSIGGHEYRADRMTVFTQMHLASEFRDGLMGLALLKKNRPSKMSDKDFQEVICFTITGGGKFVSPEVLDRVMLRSLAVVFRKEINDMWAPVCPNGQMMFSDIELPDMVVMMYEVFDHNGLLDFFSVSPSTSAGQKPKSGQRSHTERIG